MKVTSVIELDYSSEEKSSLIRIISKYIRNDEIVFSLINWTNLSCRRGKERTTFCQKIFFFIQKKGRLRVEEKHTL